MKERANYEIVSLYKNASVCGNFLCAAGKENQRKHQRRSRHDQGLDVSLAVLDGFSSEEMSHITGICQRQTGPVNADAFCDCVRIIQSENRASKVTTEDDLLALRKAYQGRKGINA